MRTFIGLAIVFVGVFIGTRLVANGTLSEPVALLATLLIVVPIVGIINPPGHARKRRERRELAGHS